jgi:hypothetical protein
VSPPTAEQQLKFLTNVQRLRAEGQFVATYKYALLLALADIAIETGDDSGERLTVSTKLIAEKFIQYYWRQVVPYVPKIDPTSGQVLRQNTGKQAAIIRQVVEARQKYGDSLVAAQRDKSAWKSLVRDVDQVVRQMPLWKLQKVGRSSFDFLYENKGKGTTIELRPGVAYCLRQFYGLIGDLVRGAWVRYIRRYNHDALGTTADLSEFLFGSERSDLSAVREILEDVQSGRCFYCEKAMRKAGHVDHFIPWSKYPLDLGHNFVVAHQTCNSAKADHLAAADYLAAWADRNQQNREHLANEFSERGVLHDLPTSARIADWAYQTTFEADGLTWAKREDMIALPADWQRPLVQLLESSN